MIVPGDDENASVTGGTGKIAVFEYVAGTIYARAFPIPRGGDPIDTSFAIGSDLLRAPDRSRRHILIDRRVQADGRTEKLARARSEEHTAALQPLMRTVHAVICLTNKKFLFQNQ